MWTIHLIYTYIIYMCVCGLTIHRYGTSEGSYKSDVYSAGVTLLELWTGKVGTAVAL